MIWSSRYRRRQRQREGGLVEGVEKGLHQEELALTGLLKTLGTRASDRGSRGDKLAYRCVEEP